ncbi:MAG: Wzz/FepE/Etk N-terminal domain-containing protein, partial [Methanococcaceae archaeon]
MTNNSFRPLNDEPIKITHVLEILYRQKWAFLLTFLFVIAITAAYSLIQKKTYEATTSIIVQDSPANVTLGLATQEVKTDNLQNQLEVLQSRDLINRVVDKLINRVYLNPGAPKTDTMMIIKKAKRAAGINDLQSSVVVENMIKEFKNSMDIDYKKG